MTARKHSPTIIFSNQLSNNYCVTSLYIDIYYPHKVMMILEKIGDIERRIEIPIEKAEEMGLIDFSKLKVFTDKY